MEPSFRNECNLTEALFSQYLKTIYKHVAGKLRTRLAVVGVVFALVGIVATAVRGLSAYTVLCLGVACITGYLYVLGYRSQLKPLVKSYTDQHGPNARMVTEFFAHRMIVTLPASRVVMRYDSIVKIETSPEMIVVFSDQNLLLPRSGFTVGDGEGLLAFLREKMAAFASPESRLKIRLETPEDYREVEALTREAFWDLAKPGCDEHYLVHKMRDCKEFIPELAYVAELEGKLVGNIMYTKSLLEDDAGDDLDVLTFGPLSVLPAYQNQGIGEALLRKSFQTARSLDYEAVFILGHPEYYKRFGFSPASEFEITMADGQSIDAFMALEFYPEVLKYHSGRLHFAPVFFDLPPEEVEAFDAQFPPREKKFS